MHPSQSDVASEDAESQCSFGMHAGLTELTHMKSIIMLMDRRMGRDLDFRTADRDTCMIDIAAWTRPCCAVQLSCLYCQLVLGVMGLLTSARSRCTLLVLGVILLQIEEILYLEGGPLIA